MTIDDIPDMTPPLVPADLLPEQYEMKKNALKKRQQYNPSLAVNVSSRSYYCHYSNPTNEAGSHVGKSSSSVIGFRRK